MTFTNSGNEKMKDSDGLKYTQTFEIGYTPRGEIALMRTVEYNFDKSKMIFITSDTIPTTSVRIEQFEKLEEVQVRAKTPTNKAWTNIPYTEIRSMYKWIQVPIEIYLLARRCFENKKE